MEKLKVTADERTADRFYYATVFKYLSRPLQHLEELNVPTEKVVEDR